MNTADALLATLESKNVCDSNLEPANVVDVLASLAHGASKIALAISSDAAPGIDATGGTVNCVVEGMIGITAGLVEVAKAISELADAVRDIKAAP